MNNEITITRADEKLADMKARYEERVLNLEQLVQAAAAPHNTFTRGATANLDFIQEVNAEVVALSRAISRITKDVEDGSSIEMAMWTTAKALLNSFSAGLSGRADILEQNHCVEIVKTILTY